MYWGKAEVYVDGKLLAISGESEAKLVLGGPLKKTIRSAKRVLGHIPAGVEPGEVSGDFLFEKGVNALALRNAAGVTVQFHCDNGEVFVVRDAAQTGDKVSVEGSDKGGMLKNAVFSGQPAEAVNA